MGVNRGQYIRVGFKDNIHAVENELYKRIRQNASKFPTDEEFLNQYKIYLDQKYREVSFLCELYKNDKQKLKQKAAIRKKMTKIMKATLHEVH